MYVNPTIATVIGHVDELHRLYGKSPIRRRDDVIHDLSLIHQAGHLKSVNFEALDKRGAVIYAHTSRVDLGGGVARQNTAAGLERPVLGEAVERVRWTWTRTESGTRAKEVPWLCPYRSQLRMRWADATPVEQAEGLSFSSEHVGRATGVRS